jgi:hypothetical protein
MHARKRPIDSLSFHKAKAAYNLRYYRWAQEQGRREVEQGFPTSQLIRNELVYRFSEIARSMNKEEQLQFLSALVKRSHPDGAELAGEEITDSDKKFIDRYVNHDRYEIAPGLQVMDATFERRGDKRIYRSISDRASLLKIDNKQLRKLVVEKLRPILGDCSVKESLDNWWYETKIGSWSIWTIITANKNSVHLSYFHRINVQEGIALHDAFGLSPVQWLGIGGSSADWKLWANSEIEETVDSLYILVNLFLDAVPLLLDGIPFPDLRM